MTKKFLILTLALSTLFLFGCPAPAERQTITIKGSDTLLQVGQHWAEVYMKAHPDVTIQVTGGGSGTGIAALIDGTTDICQASRAMKQEEKDKLKANKNVEAVETPVALDALAIYVNKENPVTALTLEQAQKVFLGEITDWKDVGGKPGKIVLYGRENSSGTYVYFKDNVLKGDDYAATAQTLPGTAAVVNAVSKDANGIGYGGAAYAQGVREVAVSRDGKGAGISPSLKTIQDGSYPITRYLFFYTRTKPSGKAKGFIDWVLSAQGQSVASEVGYFPVH